MWQTGQFRLCTGYQCVHWYQDIGILFSHIWYTTQPTPILPSFKRTAVAFVLRLIVAVSKADVLLRTTISGLHAAAWHGQFCSASLTSSFLSFRPWSPELIFYLDWEQMYSPLGIQQWLPCCPPCGYHFHEIKAVCHRSSSSSVSLGSAITFLKLSALSFATITMSSALSVLVWDLV